ncbi:MAG TPA: UMP kinase [Erysipelotrichaceae bacterium]|nr:UMP kinase [Erysipelotrichaceae bacterium]
MTFKRVLLKLSGEALKENGEMILSAEALNHMAETIKAIVESNIEVCVVIGAGNIWRGKIASDVGMERVQADFMGMLGTVINAVALSSRLNKLGVDSIVTSAISPIEGVTVPYQKEQADEAMKKGKVVFLSGGTGKPYFTTDTAAALRAVELKCDAILMGKNGVPGVYDKDPRTNEDAKFFKFITFEEMIKLNLQIMDISAIELIKDKNIKVCVFEMKADNFIAAAKGEHVGTICQKENN